MLRRMDTHEFDVVVIGAGIAGSTSAAALAAGPLHHLRFLPDLDLPPEKAARSFPRSRPLVPFHIFFKIRPPR